MKFLPLALLSFFGIGHSQIHQDLKNSVLKDKNLKYGTELLNNDFLKYADPQKMDSLETIIKDSFDIHAHENYRFLQIDSEELAEFSFDIFVPDLKIMLKKRNIDLEVNTADDYEKTYNIMINKKKINLYTQKQLDSGVFWESGSRNFFKALNDVLKEKNSEEKFYLLYGGNEMSTLLLTEKQFEIIKEYNKKEPEEIPYLP